MLDRTTALALLREHTKSESLLKHAFAVEAAMRAYARKYGEDQGKWAIVGLLHDLDYEQHPTPEEHPAVGAQILAEKGYPEDVVYAIKAHGEHLGLPRHRLLDKALYAVDELTGLVVAVALVKPGKSLAEVDVASVKKKMKDKAFARAVNREEIAKGAAELGVSLDEHIALVIEALRGIERELGLA